MKIHYLAAAIVASCALAACSHEDAPPPPHPTEAPMPHAGQAAAGDAHAAGKVAENLRNDASQQAGSGTENHATSPEPSQQAHDAVEEAHDAKKAADQAAGAAHGSQHGTTTHQGQ